MELAALADDGSFLPYPCNQHCSAFGEHLWGHRATGALFIWDPDYHRYGTGPRLCRRTAPHVRSEQKRLRHREFRLECEMRGGVGRRRCAWSRPTDYAALFGRRGRDPGRKADGAARGAWARAQQQAVWYALGRAGSGRMRFPSQTP